LIRHAWERDGTQYEVRLDEHFVTLKGPKIAVGQPRGTLYAEVAAELLSLAERLEREEKRAKEADLLRDCSEGVLHMAVARLGGKVEGRPTERVNFLQRIDELRRIEAGAADLQRRGGATAAGASTGTSTASPT
jgi:hypothetical protein